MGRLMGLVTIARHKRLSKVLWSFFLCIVIALSTLSYVWFGRSGVPTTDELTDYLKTNRLSVGTRVINDSQQVYYVFHNNEIHITNGSVNNYSPVAHGHMIAWIQSAPGQNNTYIRLYDVLNKSLLRISYFGGLIHSIAMDGSIVAWQEQVQGRSVVMYYDGVRTVQLGDEYPSMLPRVSGERIIYAQDLGDGQWQTVEYSIATKQQQVVVRGDIRTAGFPAFVDGTVVGDRP